MLFPSSRVQERQFSGYSREMSCAVGVRRRLNSEVGSLERVDSTATQGKKCSQRTASRAAGISFSSLISREKLVIKSRALGLLPGGGHRLHFSRFLIKRQRMSDARKETHSRRPPYATAEAKAERMATTCVMKCMKHGCRRDADTRGTSFLRRKTQVLVTVLFSLRL